MRDTIMVVFFVVIISYEKIRKSLTYENEVC